MNSSHPTILIGYGSYGLRVLQDLLSAASARGSLLWDEAAIPGTSSEGERRLAVLALFWIPDVLDLEDDARKHLRSSDSFEMMLDLYEQIETVEAEPENLGRVLADRVDAAKRRLFKQDLMQKPQSGISLGLDVIIIAKPTHEIVVGKLRELIEPVMTRLAEDPGLTAPRAGLELLNFIQVLDFEDFWNPAVKAIRDALGRALSGAEEALAHDHPALGRVYIFDGRTEQGNQDEKFRLNQTILFLEFLLFEGKRAAAEFRHLYQREHPGASPLCFVGLRAVEFSGARLRRLAAASFGRGWLEYMLGMGGADTSCERINSELEPFTPDQIGRTLNAERFDDELNQAVRRIEQELLALDARDPNWPQLVQLRSEKLVEEQQRTLAARSMQQLTTRWLSEIASLRKRLVSAISRCMTDQQIPVTLGAVLSTLQNWQATLASELEGAPSSAREQSTPSPAVDLGTLQREYLQTETELVTPARLRRWWPVFALGAAAVFLPIARGSIEAVVAAPPEPRWLVDAGLAAALVVFFWIVAVKLFHPLIAESVARTLNFHIHLNRGRLTDAIRSLVASDQIKGALERESEKAKLTLRRRILTETVDVLRDLVVRLQVRRDEIGWLGQQLSDYLALQEVDASAAQPTFFSNRSTGDVRKNIQTDEDLRIATSQLARDGSRFREVQRKLTVFEHWHEPFHSLLLNPHHFLDELSRFFTIGDWQADGDVAERRQHEIVSAIASFERFPISFYWRRASGLPEAVFLCSVPTHWLRFAPVHQKLVEIGYRDNIQQNPDAERIYLLQTRSNVPSALLTV